MLWGREKITAMNTMIPFVAVLLMTTSPAMSQPLPEPNPVQVIAAYSLPAGQKWASKDCQHIPCQIISEPPSAGDDTVQGPPQILTMPPEYPDGKMLRYPNGRVVYCFDNSCSKTSGEPLTPEQAEKYLKEKYLDARQLANSINSGSPPAATNKTPAISNAEPPIGQAAADDNSSAYAFGRELAVDPNLFGNDADFPPSVPDDVMMAPAVTLNMTDPGYTYIKIQNASDNSNRMVQQFLASYAPIDDNMPFPKKPKLLGGIVVAPNTPQ